MTVKIRIKYYKLFEDDNEIIYVHYQDSDGYIHYENCNDGTKQMYMMTDVEFLKYKIFTA